MAKGKDNQATIQVTKTGQYLITIPRAIGGALELKKGTKMEWVIRKEGLLLKWPKGFKQ